MMRGLVALVVLAAGLVILSGVWVTVALIAGVWHAEQLPRSARKRMGRLEYFINALMLLAVGIFLRPLAYEDEGLAAFLLMLLVSVPLFVWAVVCHVRRWHDLGKSGWNTLLLLIPIAGVFVLLYLLIAPSVWSSQTPRNGESSPEANE